MSTIRTSPRHSLILSATAAIAALAMSFADPAAASCRGCGSGHHSGSAPSSHRVTPMPMPPRQHTSGSHPVFRQAQVPARTFDPNGSSRPGPRSPNIQNQIPANTFDPNGSSRRPGQQSVNYRPGVPSTTGTGSNTNVTPNGPGAPGTTNDPASSPNASLAARICVLPAGTWCSFTQGAVGMKCHCPGNNGNAIEGIVK
jgi:hypothetical protein